MTPELVALARRAVACPEWQWMPGMLAQRTTHPSVQERGGPQTVPVRFAEGVQLGGGAGMGKPTELADPYDVELTPSGERHVASAHAVVDGWHRVANLLPDLTDPATLGCILTLVRETWGSDQCFCRQEDTPAGAKWFVLCPTPKQLVDRIGAGWHGPFIGNTEAEALVGALEAWASVQASFTDA